MRVVRMRHPSTYEAKINGFVEVNDQPSETIPDQSLTIKQILQRFTAGTLPPIQKETYYEENPDIDDPDPMYRPDFDFVDWEAAKRKLERRIKYRREANRNVVSEKRIDNVKANEPL